MGRIVVGVDGSTDSKEALAWAVDQARQYGHTVRAVYVYGLAEEHNPFLAAYASFASGTSGVQTAGQAQRWQEERDAAVHQQASELLAGVVRGIDTGGVRVDQVAMPGGRPARALIEQTKDCVTLVVGARGHGGFRGLRLGSIAEKCVRHAPCSVMVTRAPR
jgi:nucleotide-binding universal stress UspA family protein